MTQAGKCGTCRQRKVKCDEQYPKCGQCRKKNRTCLYPSTNVRRLHVTLLERQVCEDSASETRLPSFQNCSTSTSPSSCCSSDLAGDDPPYLHTEATYRAHNQATPVTFETCHSIEKISNPSRSGEPTVKCIWRTLDGPEPSLRARFVEMLDETPVEINQSFMWGGWLRLVAVRLGHNEALDDAMLCCVAGLVAHHDRSYENLLAASRTYGRALASLQRALANHHDKNAFPTEIITASKYLTAFETMLDLRGDRWEKHWRGLGKMLASRGCQNDSDDLLKSLYYQILAHYFNGAVSDGTDCAFDSPEWLDLSPPRFTNESPLFHTMYKSLMQLIVPLARLVRLVRLLRSNVSIDSVALEASDLARKLYENELDSIFDELVGGETSHLPTKDDSVARYYPTSIDFPTISLFEAQMRYCFSRIIVIGLCRVLQSYGLFNLKDGDPSLIKQELDCAGIIVMSIQYTIRAEKHIPIGSFLTMGPLQVAAGSWYRLLRDEENSAQSEAEGKQERIQKARYMMHWCREKSNSMLKAWNGEQLSHEMLQAQVDVLEGGALIGWQGRRIFPV